MGLRLGNIVTPNIAKRHTYVSGGYLKVNYRHKFYSHSVSPHEHRISIRVLVHRSLQTAGQVLFERSIIDDRDAQGIVVSKHTLALTLGDTLDLFDVVDLKASIGALFPLNQQGDQDSPLRVGMDAATRAMLKGSEEQRRASGWVEVERFANIGTITGGVLGGWPLHDKNILGLHQFLLNTRWRDVDVIAMANGSLLHVSGRTYNPGS